LLLIDTDNALGSRSGDVDDGFAIAALLRSGLPIAGLSSVTGNTGEAEADRNNRVLGALCGHPGPYLRGITGGEVAERIDLRVDLWSGEPVRVAALGPLTNVAAALRELGRRGLRPSVTEVVLVGGNASSRGRFPPVWPHEFNLTKDREAARAVLASELPLTIVPLDVARRLRIGASELAALTGPLGEHLQCHAARWLRRSRWLHGPGGFPAFDLLAAAWFFDPAAVATEETTVRVHPNLWLEFGKGGRPVRLVRGFEGSRILRRFAELVAPASFSPDLRLPRQKPAADPPHGA
jgi:inosine-uridine nucleoside N-ribohydrolase